MKRLMRLSFVFFTFLLAFATVQAATWSSSEKYGEWKNKGYILRNDIWGSGAGTQTIWANSYSDWGVTAVHPDTSGVKAYPHCAKSISKQISALSTLKSTYKVSVPSSGAWAAAYDIWTSDHAFEIMLWMTYTGNAAGGGNVKPISYYYGSNGFATPVYTGVTVGGHTWNVFRGNNGGNYVYSFVRTSKSTSGTVNILAILNWLKNKSWLSDAMVGETQFGFEITSSSGGLNFTTKSYSVTYN